MEKNRSTKIIAIAALFIAVIGLSIGFAAFSSTLTINSSATVTPDQSQWRIGFTKTNLQTLDQVAGDDALVTGIPNATADGFTAETATITNSATTNNTGTATITHLKANFTTPGQSVTYTFYVRNESKNAAYLKSVDFQPAATKCTAGAVATGDAPVTPALMSAVCDDIHVKISVGNIQDLESDTGKINDVGTDLTTSTGHTLARDDVSPVTVTIYYANNDNYVDAPIVVDLGNIVLKYDAVAYAN